MTGVSSACLDNMATKTTPCTWTAWISCWCCWLWIMVTQRGYAEVITNTHTHTHTYLFFIYVKNEEEINLCCGSQPVHRECVLTTTEMRERWEISAAHQPFTARDSISWNDLRAPPCQCVSAGWVMDDGGWLSLCPVPPQWGSDRAEPQSQLWQTGAASLQQQHATRQSGGDLRLSLGMPLYVHQKDQMASSSTFNPVYIKCTPFPTWVAHNEWSACLCYFYQLLTDHMFLTPALTLLPCVGRHVYGQLHQSRGEVWRLGA